MLHTIGRPQALTYYVLKMSTSCLDLQCLQSSLLLQGLYLMSRAGAWP